MSETTATEATSTPASTEAIATTTTTAAPATATQTPAAEPAKVEAPAWHQTFPTKYMKDGQPDIEKLIAGYQHLNTKLSSKGYAPPADIAEYDYQPQNFQVSDEDSTAFKASALEMGITTDQYSKLLGMHDAEIARILPNAETAEATLKEYWGNDYSNNLKSATKAFNEFSDETMSDDPVLNHPTVLKLLASIGNQLGEDTQSIPAATRSGRMSQEDVNAIINSSDYYDNLDKQAKVARWYEGK